MTGANKTSLSHRLFDGIRFNILGQGAVFAVNLAITPLLVNRLGPAGYALYTLMWTALGYLTLLNGGTLVAAQKYTAEYRGRSGQSPLGSLLRTALVFQLIAGVVGALVLLAIRGLIVDRMDVQGAALAAAPRVLACVALATPAYLILQFSLSLLSGMQRFKDYNIFQFFQSVSMALCAAALLLFGGGLREIAAVLILVYLLLAAWSLWSVRSALRAPATLQPGDRAGFFRFAAKSYIPQIWGVLFTSGDRVFIGSLLPLTQMGYYVISLTLAQKFNMLCGSVAAIASPLLTELHGSGEEERLRRFYIKTSELSLFFIMPFSVLSFVLVPQFLTLWLGADFSLVSTWPFRILIVSNLVAAATFLPGTVVISKGEPQVPVYAAIGKAVLLITLWPILIARLGILGAALGYLIAELAATPALIGYIHRRFLNIDWPTFWAQACWRPTLSGLVAAAAALAFQGYIHTWLMLVSLGGAGVVLYMATGYWLLDSESKALLIGWARSNLRIREGL